jgi:hypothetical protein
MPPMYFMVISQCPQTAETMKWSFFPRRPLNAGPRYWPSTTKPRTPSSMSKTAEKERGKPDNYIISYGINEII